MGYRQSLKAFHAGILFLKGRLLACFRLGVFLTEDRMMGGGLIDHILETDHVVLFILGGEGHLVLVDYYLA